MPGSNARALEKARVLDADVVIMDLEDAVAPEAKPAARQAVVRALMQGGYSDREVVIRISSRTRRGRLALEFPHRENPSLKPAFRAVQPAAEWVGPRYHRSSASPLTGYTAANLGSMGFERSIRIRIEQLRELRPGTYWSNFRS
jgi:hypothetical protein